MPDAIINALKGVDPADAMPFGAANTPEGSPTMLGNMLSGLMNIPKHAIEAAKTWNPEDIHGSTERVVPAATDAALALAGVGAPAAEAGAAGIFGGKLAKTADIKALIEANQMRNSGKSATSIWDDTGWFKSPADNKWKFEIPDNRSRMVQHGLEYSPATEANSVTGPANMMMQHPELWKAYPELGHMPLQNSVFMNPRNGVGVGGFDKPNNLISVETSSLKNARDVGLHELQHGVQDIENFARGGNPSYVAQLQHMNRVPSFEVKTDPMNAYHRLGGEVESRNVQKRMDYTPEERAAISPWESHDTKFRDQLIVDPKRDFIYALRNMK